MSYFTTRRTGDIERRLSGVRELRQFFIESGVTALTAVTQLLAALVLMFVYSWQLALVYVALTPVYALLMRFSSTRLRPDVRLARGGVRAIRLPADRLDPRHRDREGVGGRGGDAADDAVALLADRRQGLPLGVPDHDLQGAIQLVTFLSLALFLFAGGLLVINGDLSLGRFVAFNALIALANGPVLILLSLWDELQYGRILLDRLTDVVEQEPEQGEDRLRPARL